jgi:hypothetical protein
MLLKARPHHIRLGVHDKTERLKHLGDTARASVAADIVGGAPLKLEIDVILVHCPAAVSVDHTAVVADPRAEIDLQQGFETGIAGPESRHQIAVDPGLLMIFFKK